MTASPHGVPAPAPASQYRITGHQHDHRNTTRKHDTNAARRSWMEHHLRRFNAMPISPVTLVDLMTYEHYFWHLHRTIEYNIFSTSLLFMASFGCTPAA
jgi:hypothetical protein